MPDFDDMSPEEVEDYVNEQIALYTKSLDGLVASGDIESYKIEKIETHWSTWSKWKKFVWSICELTGIREWRFHAYQKAVLKIHETAFKTPEDAVKALNRYQDKHFKYWYVEYPKSSITFDVKFKAKPVENIDTSKIEVKQEGNEWKVNRQQ